MVLTKEKMNEVLKAYSECLGIKVENSELFVLVKFTDARKIFQ